MRYRKEIDGLRAIAVVPVILFHAGFDVFSGGFVGVDIFFVISGYLITSIIHTQTKAGKFKLKIFYLRRIRRIFPALFLVLITTSVASLFFLYPNSAYEYSQSLLSVLFFSSNVYFWRTGDYFATAWIQTSSATVDLKAWISSAMASAGVLHPSVFLGRLFINAATSLSHVWLALLRSLPFGMY